MANEEQQETLRDTLVASIAEHAEQADTSAPAQETDAQRESRQRDDKGRFAETGKPTVAAPQAKTSGDPSSASTVPAVAAPSVPDPAAANENKYPRVPKELWPLWDKITAGQPLNGQESRKIADFNVTREAQFVNGVSTYKQIAEGAKPLMEAIAPFQADMDKHGIQAPQMIHSLLSAHKSLSFGSPQQKLQLISKLANDYGIPIQALYDQGAQQQYLASAPAIQQPVQQAPDIKTEVDRVLAEREMQKSISDMAQDTAKYPFFNYVRATMAQLLETGEATDLADAYQIAIHAPEHATLSSMSSLQQTQAAEQQRVATAQVTAKRSATPASAGAPTGKKGVRESLREAMELHAGGARV